MDYWNTRRQALRSLDTELRPLSESLDTTFKLLDQLIDEYNSVLIGKPTDYVEYLIMCGATLAKGKHLAVGLLSLCLDGLAQEGGALGRPLVECIEKLEFYRLDPDAIGPMITRKKPRHGELAKRIKSPRKELRDYFSEHASHVAYTMDAMAHLVDWTGSRGPVFQKSQPFTIRKLRANLEALRVLVLSLCVAGWNCLAVVGYGSEPLGDELEALRLRLVEDT